MEDNNGFLGTGMKFPPQVNKADGRFEMVSGTECIRESVYLILMTQKSERFVHPEFGSSLMSFPFMEGSRALLNLMASELERDLSKAEPRIKNVDVEVSFGTEEGCMTVTVDYTIRDTNVKDNIVFPFYTDVKRGEPEWKTVR